MKPLDRFLFPDFLENILCIYFYCAEALFFNVWPAKGFIFLRYPVTAWIALNIVGRNLNESQAELIIFTLWFGAYSIWPKAFKIFILGVLESCFESQTPLLLTFKLDRCAYFIIWFLFLENPLSSKRSKLLCRKAVLAIGSSCLGRGAIKLVGRSIGWHPSPQTRWWPLLCLHQMPLR